MSYDRMEVAEGNEAGLAWERMVHAEAGSEERKRLRDALLAYCKQDTLAMAKLLEVHYEHIRDRRGRIASVNPSCLPYGQLSNCIGTLILESRDLHR
jgi:hypothetical protein